MKSLFTLLCLAVAITAFAGDKGNKPQPKPVLGDKGNIYRPAWDTFYGGDAVVCRNNKNQVTKALLLDYAEKDKYYPAGIKHDSFLHDVHYVNLLSAKLERVSPDVFASFRREALKLANQFSTYKKPGFKPSAHVRFVKGPLFEVPDSQHSEAVNTNIKGCKVEQLVVRQKKYNTVVYHVQVEIFEKLSLRDRRGLIIHEALYHSFNMYYSDYYSNRSRFFNRQISRVPLQHLTDEMIVYAMRQAYIKFE